MQHSPTLPAQHQKFIKDNWLKLSDAKIAVILNTTKNKVYQNRNVMGLHKGRNRMVRDRPISLTKTFNWYDCF
jgi:hypothetical protein